MHKLARPTFCIHDTDKARRRISRRTEDRGRRMWKQSACKNSSLINKGARDVGPHPQLVGGGVMSVEGVDEVARQSVVDADLPRVRPQRQRRKVPQERARPVHRRILIPHRPHVPADPNHGNCQRMVRPKPGPFPPVTFEA